MISSGSPRTTACGLPTDTGVNVDAVDRLAARRRDTSPELLLDAHRSRAIVGRDDALTDDDLDLAAPGALRRARRRRCACRCPRARRASRRGSRSRPRRDAAVHGERPRAPRRCRPCELPRASRVEPRAVGLDDDVRVTERAPRRGSHPPPPRGTGRRRSMTTSRNAPHPLPLVRGVASRPERRCARVPRRAGASRARRARAPSRAVREIAPPRAPAATSSTTPRANISSVRVAIRRSSSAARNVEADDERRPARLAPTRGDPRGARATRPPPRARAPGRRVGGR